MKTSDITPEWVLARRELEARLPPAPWYIGHIDENLNHAQIDDADAQPVAEVWARSAEAFVCTARNEYVAMLDAIVTMRCRMAALEDVMTCAKDLDYDHAPSCRVWLQTAESCNCIVGEFMTAVEHVDLMNALPTML